MPDEPILYEEDTLAVIDAVIYLVEHKGVPRMDLDLEGSKKAKVYWAGTVLRIDIEGLK